MLLSPMVWSAGAWLVGFAFLAIRYVLLAVAYRQIGESIEAWESLPNGFRIKRPRPRNLTTMAAYAMGVLAAGAIFVPALLFLIFAFAPSPTDYAAMTLCAVAVAIIVGAFALDRVTTPAIYRWWKSGC